jgi:hypothetical protein
MVAALGVVGAVLCAVSPAWGARGYHRTAASLIALGATLALTAGAFLLFSSPA